MLPQMPKKREPRIVTKLELRDVMFPWSATYADYEIGDPMGLGKTEQDAIEDLRSEVAHAAS